MDDKRIAIQKRELSTGDLPALSQDPRQVKLKKEGLPGFLEKMLRRLGSWGKRFAFVGYVNQVGVLMSFPSFHNNSPVAI